jgi:S-adenosylmethionine synthetase
MDVVTQAMQQATGNHYFRLVTTERKGWGRPNSLIRADRIAEAEDEKAERELLLKFVSQRGPLTA